VSDDQPPSEPKASSVPVVRFGHNRLPPGVCSACNGSGQLMNKEAEVEMCIWCKGTGRSNVFKE